MRFEGTPLHGVCTVELDRIEDDRGWFARSFDDAAFRAKGLSAAVVQCSLSRNHRRGTLRGMHYQASPHGEAKLVRCVRGAIFDVAVDLRADSPTRCGWHGVELSAENGRALYIPAGLAHGFQTLVDDTDVLYQMDYPYVADAARGVRFDDPAFGIVWPAVDLERTVSERDRAYPDYLP